MPAEFVTMCNLENLAGMQHELAGMLAELGVDHELGRSIQAAAAQAFSAICLTRDHAAQIRANLERTRGDLCLRLVFDGEQEAAGLVSALYCPPAARVVFRCGQGQGIWTAFWEE